MQVSFIMNYNIYGSAGLPPLELPVRLIEGFSGILAKRTVQKREAERILIIFELRNNNPLQVSKLLKCYKTTTYRWYYRAKELIALFNLHAVMNNADLERFLRSFLKDKDRSGAPLFYSPEEQCSIIAIATEKPRKYGIESSKWTHWELAMVAKKLGLKNDLGKKGKTGILKNLVNREKFLANKSHKIRFVYTPKHCSWLNQIEIWFGILTRKILRHGNFQSIDELRTRIANFIEYYNTIMAKVFKWTYKGKLLQA